MIPDSPGEAWFLTTRQKRVATQRLLTVSDDDDSPSSGKFFDDDAETRGLRFTEIWSALLNPGNWITAVSRPVQPPHFTLHIHLTLSIQLIFFFANVSFASLPIFLPTIIHIQLGYTSTTAQALSIPPYLLAFALLITTSHLSDYYKSRSIPLLILTFFATLGYFLLFSAGLLQPPPPAHPSSFIITLQYTGVLLTASCIFSIISLVIVWNGNNEETASGRGMGMTMLQMLGQCGPLVGTRLYPDNEGPGFVKGSAVCAGCMCVVGGLVALQRWRLVKENRRRERENRMGVEGRRRFRFIL